MQHVVAELNRISQVSTLVCYLLDLSPNVQQDDRDPEQDAKRIDQFEAKKQTTLKLSNKDDSNYVTEECKLSSFNQRLYQCKLEVNQF